MTELLFAERMRPIVWLSSLPGIEQVPVEELAANEMRSQIQDQTLGVVPTIGCEVEVQWSSLFPETAQEFFGKQRENGDWEFPYKDFSNDKRLAFDEACQALDDSIKPLFEASKQAGIPEGNDAYWEFANTPTYSWKTLATEIGLLVESGLIPKGHQHSLHVTLGGASPNGGGMAYVLSGLELLTATPERIQQAVAASQYGGHTSWARRGSEGLRARDGSVLELGKSTGTELRSLTISSAEQGAEVFEAAQLLTATLLSYRKRNEANNPTTAELASLWPRYVRAIKRVWLDNGLPIEGWGSPRDNPETWKHWAGALGQRHLEGTEANLAIKVTQQIVSQAAKIVEAA